ncbi:MAG: DUF1292 domain-containing protein [Lachnospiraceae bacterium]|jgi:uncharacterized protein YrzB (UPF0473 family)|nr:DUF1292 domain-containing protein [Lachnospiraceae bacterium]
MNDRNRDIFFNEDSDVSAVISVTDENGKEMEAEIIACIEIEEFGKEFVAVVPEFDENADEAEALILEYSEGADGEPVFTAIEDDEMFEAVTQAFNDFFAEEEDDAEEDDDGNVSYLDDIGRIIPGVSIQKD